MPAATLLPLAPGARPQPRPTYEWHVLGCDCPSCNVHTSAAGERPLPLVRLTLAGIVAGHVAAILIDPPGAIAIAADLLRWWLL